MNAEMMKCECGSTPALTCHGEAVFVQCERCGRRGPALPETESGALLRARIAWNHDAGRRLQNRRNRRPTRTYRARIVPHAIAAAILNSNR